MGLHPVESVLTPRPRPELRNFSAGTAILGGGTWLYSEPQPDVQQLVDIDTQGLALNCPTLPPLDVSFSALGEFPAPCLSGGPKLEEEPATLQQAFWS